MCPVLPAEKDALEREEDEQKEKLGVVIREIERVHYKADGEGFDPSENSHLWVVDAETGDANQLTDGDVHAESDPHWSPDSQTILFSSHRDEDQDFRPFAVDFYAIPAADAVVDFVEWRKIETFYGPKGSPAFSPDGKSIAFLGSVGEAEAWRNTHLWIVPFDGSAAARDVTSHLDVFIGNATVYDVAGASQSSPVWSVDGGKVLVQFSHHGNTTLHAISVGPAADPEEVVVSPGCVEAFSLDGSHSLLAYIQATWAAPGQIRLKAMGTGVDQLLVCPNQDLLGEWDLGDVEEVWFKGLDDNDLHGWMVRPPGFRETESYPAVVEIHGGPLSQYGNAFLHEFRCLAAQGYLVCASNPRSGRGYGEEHARGAWNDAGGKDYDDLISWTDYVEALPYVDSSRLGVTGGSYGGQMVNFIIGRTDRFGAAVTQRSIFERISVYASDWLGDEQHAVYGQLAAAQG